VYKRQFHKNADDTWTAKETKPFDLGTHKQFQIVNTSFGYQAISIGGMDLAALLDSKCGPRANAVLGDR